MNTYGFHSIHGRASDIASGVKVANPDLSVWQITGDGDALAIGGNHFIHLCRRNIDITVVLFNNEIYGLTKGQYSPTSLKGQITKSSPYGTIERPFNPIEMALASGATFVARSIDRETKHLESMLKRAADHKGTSFVEVYQNCNIFNDVAFSELTDKTTKKEHLLMMKENEPYIFGQDDDKVLNWDCSSFDVANKNEMDEMDGIVKHEERSDNTSVEFALARMSTQPHMPTPIGVFRHKNEATYEDLLTKQIKDVTAHKGEGTLKELLNSGNTFTID